MKRYKDNAILLLWRLVPLALFVIAFSACQDTPPYAFMETNPPVSDFSISINSLEVTFTNNSLHSSHYLWDFGDGETSTRDNPVHQYSAKDNYTVTLTALDNNELSDTSSVAIPVGFPVASYTVDVLRSTATFSNTSANASSFLWNFGDGETSTEENPIHVYSVKGNYTVKLTAIDNNDENSMEQDIYVPGKYIPVLLSPSFEEDSYRTDWDWNGASSSGAPTPPDGKRGCKISSSSAWIAQTFTVDDHENYTLKYWFVTKSTSLPVGAKITITDSVDPSIVIVDTSTGPSASSNDYQEASISFNTGNSKSVTLKIAYGDGETRVDLFSIE